MMKLSDLLNKKDLKYRRVATIGPNETVAAAIQKLVESDRGALSVCDDGGELVGIITERDIVRKCLAFGYDCARIRIQDVMSKKVAICKPDDDLDYAVNVMKQERIRHLPLVDQNRKVIGMVSMRDLLGLELEECRTKVNFLSDYISGGYQ